jgi:hypothetical protein
MQLSSMELHGRTPRLLIAYVNLASVDLRDPDGFVAGVASSYRPPIVAQPESPRQPGALDTARVEKSFEGD